MDEDKRETQLSKLASAKRILLPEDRSPRRGATQVGPTARSAIFLPPFARKPLIILDSGKGSEIFGSGLKAFGSARTLD
jgi:hypothetical protein